MRILLVEDHQELSHWVARALRDARLTVETAGNGADADALLLTQEYGLVILDLSLPKMDGLEVLKRMRARGSKCPVLILTARGGLQDKVQGLNLGADDYLAKPFEFEELLARVRALLRRGETSESRHLRYNDLELDLYSRTARRGGETIELSTKEFGLLEYLMRNPNRVLTRTQIGEKVWDMNFVPTSNVVDVYISSLRRKADRGFSQELIHTVKGMGYRFGVLE